MRKNLRVGSLTAAFLILMLSCKKEQTELESISAISEASLKASKLKINEIMLQFSGLEDLGANYVYEGWVLVDGAPVSTGTFMVNSEGQMSKNVFALPVPEGKVWKADKFILTIEPYPDADPMPAETHVLAGDFVDQVAKLSINHPAALGTNFSEAMGYYLLATPTTATMDDEDSGIWFINNMSGMPKAGLTLPTLPNGWIYEGWSVIDGKPVSTGRFMNGNMADDAHPYSGSVMAPPFPGEDFIMNAPYGLQFPTNLRGSMAVISVEPYMDNSPKPFAIKPLAGMVPANAMVHTAYGLNHNPGSFPTGTAYKRK